MMQHGVLDLFPKMQHTVLQNVLHGEKIDLYVASISEVFHTMRQNIMPGGANVMATRSI